MTDTKLMPLDLVKIRTLRESLGLSVAEAARRAGLKSRIQWYEIEGGKNVNPKLSTIEAIGRALQVDYRKLLLPSA